jgi:hypothetical protein
MKYYLVARTTCAMVPIAIGIEQCRGFIVGRSLRAAFEREYAGRILMVTAGAQALPGIAYVAFKKASGPFYYLSYPSNPINRGIIMGRVHHTSRI